MRKTKHKERAVLSTRSEFEIEAAGTICWLVTDLFWMLELAGVALFFGVVTMILWTWAISFPRERAERAATAAVSQWVLMNVLWMWGDLYEMPELRRWAIAAFVLSVGLVLYALKLNGWNFSVARFFRRFRVRT